MRHTLALLALSLIAAPALSQAMKQPPFVGCGSDGQQGPQPAPADDGSAPRLPAALSDRLAYYQSDALSGRLAVLAPRGWHCLATEGSNGSSLIVTPWALTFEQTTHHIIGPAIRLSYSIGSTSGRFAVIDVAPRYFPQTLPFARRVAKDIPGTQVPTKPFPGDRITRVVPTRIDYRTGAASHGLGTHFLLARGVLPIEGFVRIFPNDEMSMGSLAVRLFPGQRNLVKLIIEDTDRRLNK